MAPTSEEPYISESIYLSIWESIVQFWLHSSICQQLIICLSRNLAYISTLGCKLWYWCQSDCHQLFFTSQLPKIIVRGLLCKNLFCKMFWKLSGDEFWVLKLLGSSKTDRVLDFFLFQLSKHLSCAISCSEVLCIPLYVLWCHLTLFFGALNCCQLFLSC